MTQTGQNAGEDDPSPSSQKINTKLLIVLSFGGQIRPYGAGSGQLDCI